MSETVNAAADTTNAAEQKSAEQTAAESLYQAKPDEAKVESKESAPEQKAEAKADESAKQDEKTDKPVEYKFEVGEDSHITKEHLDKIAEYAKERGLSQEAAQKIVDLQAETLKAQRQTLAEEFKKTADGWRNTAQADKEIGGENFNRNVELAKRVVDRFGSEQFKKALNETGFGNHPELLRTFIRIGQRMGDDTLVVPSATSTRSRPIEDLFYGAKT